MNTELQKSYSLSNKDITNPIVVFILFVVISISTYKLGWNTVYVGHDFWYHAQRIESIFEQLRNEDLYSPIGYYFFNGYGYASSIGYPDFLLIIPAFLRFFSH